MLEQPIFPPSSFRLGQTSLANLIGVHPRLVKTVRIALLLTTQDFQVHDGVRSLDEQRRLVARGASRTLKSKHLVQDDGWAHAVDLVPWIDGQLSWSWPGCIEVAVAMQAAANITSVDLRWGGVWDRGLADLGSGRGELEQELRGYVRRRRAQGRSAFLDGAHFELRARGHPEL